MRWQPTQNMDNSKPPNVGTGVQKINPNYIPPTSIKKDNLITMWYVCNTPQKVTIYDITYDANGYPLFLTYIDGQWIRKSAKYFIPIEENKL